jgi:hypothetical protein
MNSHIIIMAQLYLVVKLFLESTEANNSGHLVIAGDRRKRQRVTTGRAYVARFRGLHSPDPFAVIRGGS